MQIRPLEEQPERYNALLQGVIQRVRLHGPWTRAEKRVLNTDYHLDDLGLPPFMAAVRANADHQEKRYDHPTIGCRDCRVCSSRRGQPGKGQGRGRPRP